MDSRCVNQQHVQMSEEKRFLDALSCREHLRTSKTSYQIVRFAASIFNCNLIFGIAAFPHNVYNVYATLLHDQTGSKKRKRADTLVIA